MSVMRSRVFAVAVVALLASCKKDPPPGPADAEVEAAAPAATDAAAATVEDAAVVADAGETAALDAATPAVKTVPRATATANPERDSTCQKARAAKGRNSPAAAALEAKCKALGGTM